jgi:hypothetical protein
MPEDKFKNEKKHPNETDLKKKLGKAYQTLDDTVKSIQTEYKEITREWKYSKTSGWYITYDKKKKRLCYLFPQERDFTFKMVFNDKAMKKIKEGSFPTFVAEMAADAKKYPEGTLFVFNKSNFRPDVILDLLRIKIEN